jgi:hypothetical protein
LTPFLNEEEAKFIDFHPLELSRPDEPLWRLFPSTDYTNTHVRGQAKFEVCLPAG